MIKTQGNNLETSKQVEAFFSPFVITRGAHLCCHFFKNDVAISFFVNSLLSLKLEKFYSEFKKEKKHR